MTEATLEYVKQVVDRLTIDDQLSLIEYMAGKLREGPGLRAPAGEGEQRKPQSLRGIWRDHFPPDLDIDAALYEIRHEWEKELDEVAEE